MIHLGTLFTPEEQDAEGNPAYSDQQLEKMQRRLVEAYRGVFGGRGSQEDADLVLVDLARFTRYLDTASLGDAPEFVKALDQRRAVFARIAEAIIVAGGDLDGLHKAVLQAPVIEES